MAAFANVTVRSMEYATKRSEAVSSWTRGRPWTSEEEERLIDAASMQSIAEIAIALDRSQASVRLKLKSLAYNVTDLAGFKVKDLAVMLGVTIRQIRRWRQKGYLRSLNGRITEESFSKFCRIHGGKIPYQQLTSEAIVWLRGFGYRPPSSATNPAFVLTRIVQT